MVGRGLACPGGGGAGVSGGGGLGDPYHMGGGGGGVATRNTGPYIICGWTHDGHH